jgi:hypothetical protein
MCSLNHRLLYFGILLVVILILFFLLPAVLIEDGTRILKSKETSKEDKEEYRVWPEDYLYEHSGYPIVR